MRLLGTWLSHKIRSSHEGTTSPLLYSTLHYDRKSTFEAFRNFQTDHLFVEQNYDPSDHHRDRSQLIVDSSLYRVTIVKPVLSPLSLRHFFSERVTDLRWRMNVTKLHHRHITNSYNDITACRFASRSPLVQVKNITMNPDLQINYKYKCPQSFFSA